MRVGITGARGLIGWHLHAFLRTIPAVKVVVADRHTFAEPEALIQFVSGCDAVIHLAGMNRGDEGEVARTNVALTRQLSEALWAAEGQPQVVFSSSIHIDRDTPYGISKRKSAQLLAEWAVQAGGTFTNLVLPGVFGEGGRPFYNSVVSTFCHQLAAGQIPEVQVNAPMQQLHAQEVARLIFSVLTEKRTGEIRPPGHHLTVTDLLTHLRSLADAYAQNIFPALRDSFERDLFNTYRSYLFPHHFPVPLTIHRDARGELFEAVKGHSGGQSFLSTTRPGITRGNHYHTRKVERFLVVQGQAQIKLRRVLSNEIVCFEVDGASPAYVDIPTLYTHNITNVGQNDLTTLFWTNEFFDPAAPDTTAEEVALHA
ncbi:capsule biosynthesis protein CapF [Deinococcus irradiatisoli]|uniref:Capsule biosynthesis protein CapF n=1 Tax=Deinococcus irradiatisoli TaxID=2202254 RepID=A0A2Z3JL55_9DEIO|nr:NAD-dependent epimerase/dehydratase family protein [Deinococcus irradiatisoli]AWN24636.1 capsule biosynthesis protein CapF [Deinococcus irradiatisoli]